VTAETPEATRSYGCTFGCGNPYDFILIDVASGTTEMLCLPDFARLATDMIAAVTEVGDPNVMAALAYATSDAIEQPPGPSGKRRGKNAPATTTDPDIFGAFDSIVTEHELPPEFL